MFNIGVRKLSSILSKRLYENTKGFQHDKRDYHNSFDQETYWKVFLLCFGRTPNKNTFQQLGCAYKGSMIINIGKCSSVSKYIFGLM